jgi:hypothetical protein
MSCCLVDGPETNSFGVEAAEACSCPPFPSTARLEDDDPPKLLELDNLLRKLFPFLKDLFILQPQQTNSSSSESVSFFSSLPQSWRIQCHVYVLKVFFSWCLSTKRAASLHKQPLLNRPASAASSSKKTTDLDASPIAAASVCS